MTDQELDALVAEKVMGWQLVENHGAAGGRFWTGHGDSFDAMQEWEHPYFSTDIAAAWQVVEKIKKDHRTWFLEVHDNAHQTWCAIWENDGKQRYGWLAKEYDTTAPRAICLAALRAKGVEV